MAHERAGLLRERGDDDAGEPSQRFLTACQAPAILSPEGTIPLPASTASPVWRPEEREGKVESILEMIQGLISKFFGSSAVAVIQSFIDKIIGLIGSIFGGLKPATR
jgi:hypothetical protein